MAKNWKKELKYFSAEVEKLGDLLSQALAISPSCFLQCFSSFKVLSN